MNNDKLENLIAGKQVLALVCNQWGDTGKGKLSDLFAPHFDIIARGTGGSNAGHTVQINGKKKVFHLIPAGITYDKNGKINVLGHGMVINPESLIEEIISLHNSGGTTNNLKISQDAVVVMPYHLARDRAAFTSQEKGGIGSTGRGIGPAYSDYTARTAIFMKDLLDKDILAKKVKAAIIFYNEIYKDTNDKVIIDQIVNAYYLCGNTLKDYFCDTKKFMQDQYKQGKKILLEGAQGLLLSIDLGIYPHVTSSDCSKYGTAIGAGLFPDQVDMTLGTIKFPVMTRVGGGPFPTELAGEQWKEYTGNNDASLEAELKRRNIPYEYNNGEIAYDTNHQKIIELKNSSEDLLVNIGLRLAGNEYGATTGRPRRIGWTDLVLLKKAIEVNGPNIALMKCDLVENMKYFSLGVGYRYITNLSKVSINDGFYGNSAELENFAPTLRFFLNEFEEYSAWGGKISESEGYGDLPRGLTEPIEFMIKNTDANVRLISVGPDREQTIIK